MEIYGELESELVGSSVFNNCEQIIERQEINLRKDEFLIFACEVEILKSTKFSVVLLCN